MGGDYLIRSSIICTSHHREELDGWEMGHVWVTGERGRVVVVKTEGRRPLEDLGIDVSIVLK